jgi:hypothetical protein
MYKLNKQKGGKLLLGLSLSHLKKSRRIFAIFCYDYKAAADIFAPTESIFLEN